MLPGKRPITTKQKKTAKGANSGGMGFPKKGSDTTPFCLLGITSGTVTLRQA